MALRKDANTLNSSERSELVNALLQLKKDGIYDQFVLRHATANMMSIHRCSAFLPWHRRFLWDFEQELQRVSGNNRLGIPYWNWPSGNEEASMWSDDLLGGDGNTQRTVSRGPFREGQWVVVDSSGNAAGPLQRQLGQGTRKKLPSEAELEVLLQTTPYDSSPWNMSSKPSFRNQLEGWLSTDGPSFHNLGHVWVGGSMLPMTSPNDPVFFMHHAMVDKLWYEWQLRFPSQRYLPTSGGLFGQNRNDPMSNTPVASIGSRPVDVLDSAALGIEYDQLLPGTPRPTNTTRENLIPQLVVDSPAISAAISTQNESDIYRFRVVRRAYHTIETKGETDTYLSLFGPNDVSTLIQEDDDSGTRYNSRIRRILKAGEYYARVRHYSADETGAYSISVNKR